MAKVAKIDALGRVKHIEEQLQDFTPTLPQPTKQDQLQKITLTTQSGKVFDGNMDARNNMMAAIKAAEIIGQLESDWKLADNSIANVTLDELNEALALAIQAAGQIYLNS